MQRQFIKARKRGSMHAPGERGERYAFGPFRLDPIRRALTRDATPVAVTSTALDVLIYLVEHPGRVVTKEELLDVVWPNRVVEEANVRQTVFTLRKALGDDGDRMIATAPGRGYRFTETVRCEVHAPPDNGERIESARLGSHRHSLVYALGVVGAVGAALLLMLRGPSSPAGQPRTVVLADFENRTRDAIFDRTLANLLRVDLSQSPFLQVVSEKQAQQTLALMTRRTDAPVTPGLAEEICTRTGGDTVLQGAIATLGARYLLTLTATDCSGTRVLDAEKEEARGQEGVAPALDRLMGRVRAKLGESTGSIRRFDVPLLPERTGSLAALKAYSEAKWLFDHGRSSDAIPLDGHAIELDPEFLPAYVNLGVIYAALNDDQRSAAYVDKAYRLRSTANERQRLQVTALYHQLVTRDVNEAIRNLRVWTAIYPQDAVAWSNLANAEDNIGGHAQAVVDGKRAVALRPGLETPYVVLARAQLAAGRADEAFAVARLAVERGLASDATHRELLRIADARDDAAGVDREKKWADGNSASLRTQEVAAEMALSRGQVDAASTAFDRISRSVRDRGTYDYTRPLEAQFLIQMGFVRPAGVLLASTDDAIGPDADTLLARAAIGDVNRAERRLVSEMRAHPSDTLLLNVYAPEVRAVQALRRGDAAAASSDLTPALPFAPRTFDTSYLLGSALLAANRGRDAAGAFGTILAHRGWSPESPLYPLAKLGLARSLRKEGDQAGSARAYQSFLRDWAAADPGVPILRAAKQELAAERNARL